MLNSDDLYYRGAARCGSCEYLYFPEDSGTWNSEPWITDFERKAELVLQQSYSSLTSWQRDVYLVLHFLDCLDKMVTWYFSAPEFSANQRLLQILETLEATKSINTLKRIVDIASRPNLVLERFGLVGDTSEKVDDAWEEVTGELSQSIDADLRHTVYIRLMLDRNIEEFLCQ